MSHLLQRMAPERAKSAAAEYLAAATLGRQPESTAARDLAALPADERTPQALVLALSQGEPGSLPWYARAAFRDLVNPLTILISREYPKPWHRAIVKVIPVSDFRPRNILAGPGMFDIYPIDENGEIVSQSAEPSVFDTATVQPKSYGSICRVSRQTLTNDTGLGWFNGTGEALIRSAYQHEGDAVFTLLESGATLADGNSLYDATNSITGPSIFNVLIDAFQALAEQKIDDKTLDIQPSVMVVPSSWSIVASDIVSDILLSVGTGNLKIFKSVRVSSGYLFANPQAFPVIGLAGFDQIVPAIDFKRDIGGIDGLAARVRHDYTVTAMSRVGICKMTVAP